VSSRPKGGAPVFLDSGIFAAFMDGADRHHSAAVSLFSSPPHRWCTSLAVVSETYSWFLHRHGEEAARTFRGLLSEMTGLRLLPVDVAHHDAVVRKLEALRGHKLTYVDASSLVFIAHLRVREVWGTDRDLGIEGARVIPVA
jgi:predicted nucleic acid-binding protein